MPATVLLLTNHWISSYAASKAAMIRSMSRTKFSRGFLLIVVVDDVVVVDFAINFSEGLLRMAMGRIVAEGRSTRDTFCVLSLEGLPVLVFVGVLRGVGAAADRLAAGVTVGDGETFIVSVVSKETPEGGTTECPFKAERRARRVASFAKGWDPIIRVVVVVDVPGIAVPVEAVGLTGRGETDPGVTATDRGEAFVSLSPPLNETFFLPLVVFVEVEPGTGTETDSRFDSESDSEPVL